MKTVKEIMEIAVERALSEGMEKLKSESKEFQTNISKADIREMIEKTIQDVAQENLEGLTQVYVYDNTDGANKVERAYEFYIYKGEQRYYARAYLRLNFKKRSREYTHHNFRDTTSYEIKSLIVDEENPDKTLREIWYEWEESYIRNAREKREKVLGENIKKFKELSDDIHNRMLNGEEVPYDEYMKLKRIMQDYRKEMEKIAEEKNVEESKKEIEEFIELYCKSDEDWGDATKEEIEDWEILSEKFIIPCSICEGTGERHIGEEIIGECEMCSGKGFRLSKMYYNALDTFTREEKYKLSKKLEEVFNSKKIKNN